MGVLLENNSKPFFPNIEKLRSQFFRVQVGRLAYTIVLKWKKTTKIEKKHE
jgi:hypothetical protein